MYVVVVEFRIATRHVGAFREAVLRQAAASLAAEAACRQFDVCVDPEQPELVLLYELYDDRAAFDRHLETQHFLAFDAATASWIENKSVRAFTRLDREPE